MATKPNPDPLTHNNSQIRQKKKKDKMRECTSVFILKLYTANNLSVQTWNDDDDDALLFMLNACKKSLVYQQAALRSGILFQNPFVFLRQRK